MDNYTIIAGRKYIHMVVKYSRRICSMRQLVDEKQRARSMTLNGPHRFDHPNGREFDLSSESSEVQ